MHGEDFAGGLRFHFHGRLRLDDAGRFDGDLDVTDLDRRRVVYGRHRLGLLLTAERRDGKKNYEGTSHVSESAVR